MLCKLTLIWSLEIHTPSNPAGSLTSFTLSHHISRRVFPPRYSNILDTPLHLPPLKLGYLEHAGVGSAALNFELKHVNQCSSRVLRKILCDIPCGKQDTPTMSYAENAASCVARAVSGPPIDSPHPFFPIDSPHPFFCSIAFSVWHLPAGGFFYPPRLHWAALSVHP